MTNQVAMDVRMWRSSGIGTIIRELTQADIPGVTYLGPSLFHETFPTRPYIPCEASIYSLSEQWKVPLAYRKSQASLFHSPHYNVPVSLASRSIVTVCDLIHLKFPQYLPSAMAYRYAQFYFYHVIPHARALITISEYTKNDLVRDLGISPEKITVTPLAVSDLFKIPDTNTREHVLKRYGLPKDYFLYVGNVKEFKNVPWLIQTHQSFLKRFPEAPPLVLVGKNLIKGYEKTLLNTPGVRWLSEVDGNDLSSLYNGATAFLFISLYEGFGLPPLEAMACGTPVISSNSASLPEVVGEAAIVIDPKDDVALHRAMEKFWLTPSSREEWIQKGFVQVKRFNWEKTTTLTRKAYESIL